MSDPEGPDPASDGSALDRMLAGAQVLIMAGPGGVGKTTLAAALGVRAAKVHDRRVVVVTVDPARRLAEALGVSRLTEEPVLVPVGDGPGRLWMLMVDMAKSWDALIDQHAPTPDVGAKLLANGLYRTLTRRFVQSHDYIALDHLVSLSDRGRYDLVIVDTPPSGHALDLLDAPGRMIDFFESRLLKWLTAGSGLTAVAARPFLAIAERLLGTDFLSQIIEFFTLFAKLRPAFVARAKLVSNRLADDSTDYVVVTTTDPTVVGSAQELVDELDRRDLPPELVVLNRFVPTLRLTAESVLEPRHRAEDFSQIADPALAAAVTQLLQQAGAATRPRTGGDCPVVTVPWSAEDLTDVRALAGLLDRVGASPTTPGH